MMTGRVALALASTIGLLFVDYLVVVAAFLTAPELGGWLAAAGLSIAVAGYLLRQRWLVITAQNAVVLLSILHAVRDETQFDISTILYFTGLVMLGNLLVWPVAAMTASARSADL